jgi:hypothetical protein
MQEDGWIVRSRIAWCKTSCDARVRPRSNDERGSRSGCSPSRVNTTTTPRRSVSSRPTERTLNERAEAPHRIQGITTGTALAPRHSERDGYRQPPQLLAPGAGAVEPESLRRLPDRVAEALHPGRHIREGRLPVVRHAVDACGGADGRSGERRSERRPKGCSVSDSTGGRRDRATGWGSSFCGLQHVPQQPEQKANSSVITGLGAVLRVRCRRSYAMHRARPIPRQRHHGSGGRSAGTGCHRDRAEPDVRGDGAHADRQRRADGVGTGRGRGANPTDLRQAGGGTCVGRRVRRAGSVERDGRDTRIDGLPSDGAALQVVPTLYSRPGRLLPPPRSSRPARVPRHSDLHPRRIDPPMPGGGVRG